MNDVRAIGCKPYRMLYGRDPILPSNIWLGRDKDTELEDVEQYKLSLPKKLADVWEKASAVAQKYSTETKEYYDRSHKDVEYQLGDKVLLYRFPKKTPWSTVKFMPRWVG